MLEGEVLLTTMAYNIFKMHKSKFLFNNRILNLSFILNNGNEVQSVMFFRLPKFLLLIPMLHC